MCARVNVQLKPSNYLAIYLLALFTLTFSVLLLVDLPLLITGLLFSVLVIYAAILWWRLYHRYFNYQISEIVLNDQGWHIGADNRLLPVELVSTLVWPLMMGATYQCALTKRQHKVLVLKDSCDKESFRRLCILWRSVKSFSRA